MDWEKKAKELDEKIASARAQAAEWTKAEIALLGQRQLVQEMIDTEDDREVSE